MIGGWKSGLYAFLLALAVFTVFFSVVTMARAQEEIGLEGVSQKELEGLPVREGGVLAQTWDWFIGLLGYEVPDVEVVKRSIIEQDLDIEDVRLVEISTTKNITVTQHDVLWGTPYTKQITVPDDNYKVIVTPTQTYDIPPKTSCYEWGNEYVCESTLRCDGSPGIEFGCEYTKISKQPNSDGSISTIRPVPLPVRDFVSRKDVIMSPEKIVDAELTMHIDKSVIDTIKQSLVNEEVAVE